MSFDDVQQPFALFLGFCQCNFLRQVKVISAYYAVPDHSIAAFCNLLIGLVSVFQTIWISDRNGAGEPVRQFDFVQLLLNGLAQFDLVDVVQDEHRLDDLAESLHRLIEAMLVRIGIQAAENARCRCLFEFDRNDQAQKVVPGFENDLLVYIFLWRNHPVAAAFVLAVPELVECLFLDPGWHFYWVHHHNFGHFV